MAEIDFAEFELNAIFTYQKEVDLYPPVSKLFLPKLHYMSRLAGKLWGSENGQRYHNILEWEFKHRRVGENHPCWQGGKSFEPYCPKFNSTVKEQVREKFGRKCFLCGRPEKANGKKLSVHHVDYDKMQGCGGKSWKLVPLCSSCHTKTNNQREYWEKAICTKLSAIENPENSKIANNEGEEEYPSP